MQRIGVYEINNGVKRIGTKGEQESNIKSLNLKTIFVVCK